MTPHGPLVCRTPGNLSAMDKDQNLHHSEPVSGISIPVTYQSEWQDGFGAHGWKLDLTASDDRVIACTSYTGDKTPTSVLIHDMLDHLVSGFPLSGYRNEAMATTMHGLRNGIETTSSFEWMANEMLTASDLNESLLPFLPANLAGTLPDDITPGLAQVNHLLQHTGRDKLHSILLEGFFRVGMEGVPRAIRQWHQQDLAFCKMRGIGLALQALLEQADGLVMDIDSPGLSAIFNVSSDACEIQLKTIVGTAIRSFKEEVM